ncbi:MAG: glycosyltransferase family 4 protein [Gammaproteobacteria bacterium]|nr:glycosyltransferase family 4 protein [Gammaproteobacteria bacterium]
MIVVGSFAAGGAERVAATLANAWQARGAQVWLVSTYLGTQEPAYVLHPGVTSLELGSLLRGEMRRRAPLRKLLSLRALLRRLQPDVIVSLLSNVNVLTLLAGAGLRVPVIVSERTDPLHDPELPWSLRLARALTYRFADALVVQTAAAARRYAARLSGVRRLAVIHNPLPAELASSELRAAQEGTGGCIVAMGRLTPEKGFSRLIGAFASAFGSRSSWSLRIWGEGPLRARLQAQVEELRLDGRVELCGLTTRPWEALASGQIFVLSSAYEGFPNAMLEAMALGLACVAFDCPSGPQELAEAGACAWLVPPGDVAALGAAMLSLAEDPGRRAALGTRAAARVRERFALPAVVTQWEALIEQVGSGARGAGADTPAIQ